MPAKVRSGASSNRLVIIFDNSTVLVNDSMLQGQVAISIGNRINSNVFRDRHKQVHAILFIMYSTKITPSEAMILADMNAILVVA